MKKTIVGICMLLGLNIIYYSKALSIDYTMGLEIKPLTAILSLVPGISAVEMEIQLAILQNSEIVLDTAFDNNNPSDTQYEENKDVDKYDLSARRYKTYNGALGYRWYSSRPTSSFYVGFFGGYSSLKMDYLYKDTENLEITASPYFACIDLGYRWLWDNGINLRLGLKGTITPYSKYTIKAKEQTDQTTDAINAAETKFNGEENKKTQIAGGIDLGLGIVF